MQLKLSALEAATGGLTMPVHGAGGDWILKLPSRVYEGLPENEHAMMTLAARLGIETPEVRLVDTGQVRGLPPDLGDFAGGAKAINEHITMLPIMQEA